MKIFGDIKALRRRTIRIIVAGCWLFPPILALMAIGGLEVSIVMIGISIASNIIPTIHAITARTDYFARMMVGALIFIQPAIAVTGMQDLGWQVDGHLYFLVGMATLAALCDIRPLILSAVLIATHHLALNFAMPAAVFSGNGSIFRVLFHAVAVVIMCVTLCYMSVALGKILRRAEKSHHLSEEQARMMEEQAASLQVAFNALEEEKEARKHAEDETKRKRALEYRLVAESFESSIRSVTKSVADTAQLLGGMTKSLDQVAKETGDQAGQVAHTASAATQTTNKVARGIGELSQSIAKIADGVRRQRELALHATQRSVRGGETVGSLAQHTDTIEEATRAIVRIAERTNLLSLNAAIEAASAGPAGRGFTVVAQEVKALAGQAGEAATEIDDFLKSIRIGAVDAETSFTDIDQAISELNKAAQSIREDVETQRRSADTMEDFARNAASEVDEMAKQSQSLADTASAAKELSSKLDDAAAQLLKNATSLEQTAQEFAQHLRAA
ncbi:methyl-accepting chemotaxis protein [Erythrobacter sp. YT30]|uniref:methyl-accepting chemotaxis protein n=1 Tax=Erythrobacter sp. YT30 TaxID=1735012 RepID=UPI0009EA84D0|nr:methyl-accepting chemotaxis protein [Erythrobacter sp. YT30]